jgi:DNA-binding response OmpR family regulator
MYARAEEAGRRPHVVIAHTDAAYVLGAVRAFRRNGWHFSLAATGPEARRLASSFDADLVVLQADLPGESGWLTCAKIHFGDPRCHVILVSDDDEGDEGFAEFAGAARLVTRAQGAEALLDEVPLAVSA